MFSKNQLSGNVTRILDGKLATRKLNNNLLLHKLKAQGKLYFNKTTYKCRVLNYVK